jgi:L-ascorbate metabolism protein UlaG (beta-lactamase superfamily)
MAHRAARGATGTTVAGLLRQRTGWLLAAGAASAAAWALRDISIALGRRPTGARAARVESSPQYRDGAFHNPVATRTVVANTGQHTVRDLLFGGAKRKPSAAVPMVIPAAGVSAAEALHVTWYGHASALVELDGRRVLIDPVWSERCSPSSRIGPRRLHPPPVAIDELPAVDAILISHDHYDHLDTATVRVLTRTQSAPFLVPLGVGAHLDRWRVPPTRIVELDWEDSVEHAGLRFTATAARHFSGRAFARDRSLWCSWVIAGATQRLFYSGDSGYFDAYAAIGETHGPFDASLIQIGAYDAAWPHIHMYPEEGVTAHLDLRGGLLIPVHWATFNLALHSWAEPVDRLWLEAKERDIRLAVPRPGERISVAEPPVVDGWWQTVA